MTTSTLTPEQIKSVKAIGFLLNRGTNKFNGRIITENGIINSEQMKVISEAAKKFGSGEVTFTVRLNIEIIGIDYENIEPFREYISKAGLVTGGTGAKVRPTVCCKGTTCVYGLCDSQGIASEIHKRYFEGYSSVVLPHKFKIAVGGCPNNCAKPDINDIGIVGQRVVNYDIDKCKNCKKCKVMEVCPMNAASIKDDKLAVDKSICSNCGRCASKCPFDVCNDYNDMVKVYLGGKWGKKNRMGSLLNNLYKKEDALNLIEKIILLFKSKGLVGERFGDTIDRLGFDNVEKLLLSDELIKNKNEILAN